MSILPEQPKTKFSSTGFEGPMFIIGMPRSGTKLLRNLLNQHPIIRMPEIETEFFPWLVNHINAYGDLSNPDNFRRFHAHITRFPYFMFRADEGLVIDASSWHAMCQSYSAAGVFEALIRSEVGAALNSGMIWGDKSPSYINDIPLIARLYPQARFIHIIRDVRDYCLSIHKAWGKDMLRAAQRWADGVRKARKDGAQVGAGYMEVRYEDLLGDVEGTLSKVCEHLSIEFYPAMLTLNKPSENIGDTRGARKVVKDNIGKFLHRLPQSALKRIESIAKEVMLACGYTLIHQSIPTRRLSSLELLLAQAKDGWHLVFNKHRRRGFLSAILFHIRYYKATRG